MIPDPHRPDHPDSFLDTPVSPELVKKALGFVARSLLRAGVLSYLEDVAAKSDNPWDDLAIKIFTSALTRFAEF